MRQSRTQQSPSEWARLRGWILYDGQCGLCSQTAVRWRERLLREGYVFVSSIDEDAHSRRVGRPVRELDEMKLIGVDGRELGGSLALAEIARHLWWARPLSWLARFPLTQPIGHAAYRWVAGHRHGLSRLLGYKPCTDGACAVRRG